MDLKNLILNLKFQTQRILVNPAKQIKFQVLWKTKWSQASIQSTSKVKFQKTVLNFHIKIHYCKLAQSVYQGLWILIKINRD